MSTETEFVNGLIVKAPNENAPEYVKSKLSINNAELIAFLQERLNRGEKWTSADVKVSQGGKWYCQVDNWKPNASSGGTQRKSYDEKAGAAEAFASDDVPF